MRLAVVNLKSISRAGIFLAAFLVLSGCTVSGAGFLHNNTGDREVQAYDYPPLPVNTGRRTITVRRGDTLYSLAKAYNVNSDDLARENNIRYPEDLKPGQELIIPGPRVHKVRQGETITSISKSYGVQPMALAQLNSISAPYHIEPGWALELPANAADTGKPSRGLGYRLNPFASGKKKETTHTGQSRSVPRGGGRFIWPVEGKIISQYGSKGGGRRNDGINIQAAQDTHILAIADGTVTYVGNELRSYGNLVLVRHSGNWVSAYAHTRQVWVKEGEEVTKGKPIATVGQSGDASRPQLHFELRRGSKSVDPSLYLNTKKK